MVTRKRDDSKLCISWILKAALKDFGPITSYGPTIITWKFLEGLKGCRINSRLIGSILHNVTVG